MSDDLDIILNFQRPLGRTPAWLADVAALPDRWGWQTSPWTGAHTPVDNQLSRDDVAKLTQTHQLEIVLSAALGAAPSATSYRALPAGIEVEELKDLAIGAAEEVLTTRRITIQLSAVLWSAERPNTWIRWVPLNGVIGERVPTATYPPTIETGLEEPSWTFRRQVPLYAVLGRKKMDSWLAAIGAGGRHHVPSLFMTPSGTGNPPVPPPIEPTSEPGFGADDFTYATEEQGDLLFSLPGGGVSTVMGLYVPGVLSPGPLGSAIIDSGPCVGVDGVAQGPVGPEGTSAHRSDRDVGSLMFFLTQSDTGADCLGLFPFDHDCGAVMVIATTPDRTPVMPDGWTLVDTQTYGLVRSTLAVGIIPAGVSTLAVDAGGPATGSIFTFPAAPSVSIAEQYFNAGHAVPNPYIATGGGGYTPDNSGLAVVRGGGRIAAAVPAVPRPDSTPLFPGVEIGDGDIASAATNGGTFALVSWAGDYSVRATSDTPDFPTDPPGSITLTSFGGGSAGGCLPEGLPSVLGGLVLVPQLTEPLMFTRAADTIQEIHYYTGRASAPIQICGETTFDTILFNDDNCDVLGTGSASIAQIFDSLFGPSSGVRVDYALGLGSSSITVSWEDVLDDLSSCSATTGGTPVPPYEIFGASVTDTGAMTLGLPIPGGATDPSFDYAGWLVRLIAV